jgi:hypothetical protein
LFEVIVKVHAPAPEQSPCQPLNTAPAPADAVNVTDALESYDSLQSPGQLIPGPETLPLPVTDTVNVGRTAANTAVTDLSESIVTVQVPVPVHAPCQPVKAAPELGFAVSVTMVPLA